MLLRIAKCVLCVWAVLVLAEPAWAQGPGGGNLADREFQRQRDLERQRRQALEDQTPDIHLQVELFNQAWPALLNKAWLTDFWRPETP